MKSGPLLLLLALAAFSPARATGPVPPSRTSSRLKQEIQDSFPKFLPPPPPMLDRPKAPAPDPEVFDLPKVTVREKRLQRIEADDLLTKRELNRKFARDYRNSLSGLDAALNRFTIPIFSASPAERGRALAEQRRLEDIRRIAEIGKAADAENSAVLKADVDKSEKSMEWRNRPAGEGRKK